MCSCVCSSAYPLLSSAFYWAIHGLLALCSSCSAIAAPLLPLPLLRCHFFYFQLSLKRQRKILEKSHLLSIMLQPSLLAYKVIIANFLCKWGFVFALVSSVFSFRTSYRIPSSRPLGKVHPLWLQSHLEFIEVSNSKTSGTLKQSSLGLVLSGATASSWIIMCFPECVREVFKTAGARVRAGIWLFDWQSLCSGKVGQQGRVQQLNNTESAHCLLHLCLFTRITRRTYQQHQ